MQGMFYCEQNQLLTQKPTIAFRFLVQCIEDFQQKADHNKIVSEAEVAYEQRYGTDMDSYKQRFGKDYKKPDFFK